MYNGCLLLLLLLLLRGYSVFNRRVASCRFEEASPSSVCCGVLCVRLLTIGPVPSVPAQLVCRLRSAGCFAAPSVGRALLATDRSRFVRFSDMAYVDAPQVGL